MHLSDHCYVIAEAGICHNGLLSRAFQLCDIAKHAGADAVKFQQYHTGLMVRDEMRLLLRKYELRADQFIQIADYCKKIGIRYLASVFDLHAADETPSEIIKVGSGEITNLRLLKAIGALNKPLILSTGMCSIHEIFEAVSAFGSKDYALLHCVSAYPTAPEDCNLQMLETLRYNFRGVPVGFSDHTQGFHAANVAVAMGAKIIEKHFTFDQGAEGPDHKFSLPPERLAQFVAGIRKTEEIMGDGVKRLMPGEAETQALARGRWIVPADS